MNKDDFASKIMKQLNGIAGANISEPSPGDLERVLKQNSEFKRKLDEAVELLTLLEQTLLIEERRCGRLHEHLGEALKAIQQWRESEE